MTDRLLVSFSGGETSAYMTWRILREWRSRYREIVIVFANTSEENEQTLQFVDLCDRQLFAALGARVVWIEAAQAHGERRSAGFRVVDFTTAARDGAVFEDMIRKYGIPNTKFKHCTRSLKRVPIEAFAKSLGWGRNSYDTAIGIRADEIDRMSEGRDGKRLVYPLVTWAVTKPMINAWWSARPARLALKGWQGNCKWCWKKSFRKLVQIYRENPTAFDFPRRMEAEYGLLGPEFQLHDVDADYRRRFFRESRTVDDIAAMSAALGGRFNPPDDDSQNVPHPDFFDPGLDQGGGCEETCEVYADEDGE